MRFLLAILLGGLLWGVPALAEETTTPADLQAGGHLQVATSLQPQRGLVPGQRGRLVIEIATDTWFTGGTRIRIPEVPGLVILQTEQFASNASENRGGQSWVVQRWSLDVYAQRAGDFDLPPLALEVKVNGGSAGNVEGPLVAPALGFTVELPPALEQVKGESWVASPDFTINQSFDRDLQQLAVGDAFARDIRFEASDVLAMMLPAFGEQAQAGLAAYPDPPQLDNRTNRGQSSGRRSQRINYLVEAEGIYRLEEQEFLWWDTANGELRLLSLPAVEFTVGSPAAGNSRDQVLPPPRSLALWGAGLLLLAAILWLARRNLQALPWDRLLAPCRRTLDLLKQLRRPALPASLNPGSNAGD